MELQSDKKKERKETINIKIWKNRKENEQKSFTLIY
jgi:hypothetical protein